MTDHVEEQEMEAEALAAIFDTAFETISSSTPYKWSVKLMPVDCGGDEEEEAKQNFVAVHLLATIPSDYPECLPELDIDIIKGLAQDQKQELLQLANNEAEANAGMPAIFAVCEAVRTWLSDNNVKGLDDGSMHAQMMRRAKEAEKSKAHAERSFEAQKKTEEMTEAELEEQQVRKRRAEGTPCTLENFLSWKKRFEEEMEKKQKEEAMAAEKEANSGRKKGTVVKKDDDFDNRLTGFEQFSGKLGIMNMDDMEAAADAIENNMDDLDVDEELFDDDEDLDDLDFDDEDDGYEDESEEDIDI